jgi:hypothetical protein
MTTRLDKPLKREVMIDGAPYTVTFTPDEIRIVEKGRRTGQTVSWRDLLGGSAGLTRSLEQSLAPAATTAPAAPSPGVATHEPDAID